MKENRWTEKNRDRLTCRFSPQRIAAIAAIVLLVGMYIVTFVLAVLGDERVRGSCALLWYDDLCPYFPVGRDGASVSCGTKV